jgi:hypothetical protein
MQGPSAADEPLGRLPPKHYHRRKQQEEGGRRRRPHLRGRAGVTVQPALLAILALHDVVGGGRNRVRTRLLFVLVFGVLSENCMCTVKK